MEEQAEQAQGTTSRRAFMLAAGAGAVSTGVLARGLPAFAADSSRLAQGDAAILRFLAAAEILETDLWQQYNELAGSRTARSRAGSGNPPTPSPRTLDEDMAQYIHDNTDDEISHFKFINAYLGERARNRSIWIGSAPCRAARRPAPSRSDGSPTSCSSPWIPVGGPATAADKNPDLGDTFPQAGPGSSQGKFPAIPRTMPTSRPRTTSRPSPTRRGSISPFIEQGGTSLYPRLAQGSPIWKCCASCSASAPPRRCTSRPGTTRRAMRLPLTDPPTG